MEKFNQVVRAFPLVVLTLAAAWGFVVSKVISTESVLIILSMVYNFWFKADEEKRRTQEMKEAVKAVATPTVVMTPPLTPTPPPTPPAPEAKP